MTRAGLTLFAALGLTALAAPAVFATATVSGAGAADDAARESKSAESGRMDQGLTQALDRWCDARSNRVCQLWASEARQPHALLGVDRRGDTLTAQVPLRGTSTRVRLRARRSASGWAIEDLRGAPTVRCGTPAFDAVRAAVRGASPTWAARVDGCAPDALRPIEITRAQLRPVLIRGRAATAQVGGPARLTLTWRDGGWRAAPEAAAR